MNNATLFMFFRNMTIFLATVMLIKYFIFLLLAAVYPVREQLRRQKLLKREIRKYGYIRIYRPVVSVVIPAWNEEVGILKTVKSIIANDYPNIEIVVVNDGSTDYSRHIVDAFIDEYNQYSEPKPRRLIKQYYVEN